MAADATRSPTLFDPTAFERFRFVGRELDRDGHVRLQYALDHEISFVEEFDLPIDGVLSDEQIAAVEGLLSLLHWVAGVSYFKTAAPPLVACETGAPPPATAALLEALYSEGLGEFAYTNGLAGLPRPVFAPGPAVAGGVPVAEEDPRRVLVPAGGGKDSAVAVEIVRRSGCELSLFSIGDAPPILSLIHI